MNLSEFFTKMNKHFPVIIVVLCWLIVFPIRVILLLLLPIGARYPYHKLHKIRDFIDFDIDDIYPH